MILHLSTIRRVKSLAARMWAANARRNPERAERWEMLYMRYERAFDDFKREAAL